MSESSLKNHTIPLWRKVTYAMVVVVAALLVAEGICRLLVPERLVHPVRRGDEEPFPSLQAFVDAALKRPPPPPPGPVMIRDPADPTRDLVSGTGCSFAFAPERLSTSGRHVLVFGASSVFGSLVYYRQTFSALLQDTLRRELNEPDLQVHNLGCPGLTMAQIAARVSDVLTRMKRQPEAVVVYSGNNEFYHVAPLLELNCSLSPIPLRLVALAGQWLGKSTGSGPEGPPLEQTCARALDPRAVGRDLWRPCGIFDDASFWPRLRKAKLALFAKDLKDLTIRLHRDRMLWLLIPPPINLGFHPAAIQKQPVTYRPLGRAGYRDLCVELEGLARLEAGARHQRLKAFTSRIPDSPLAWYMLARSQEARGQHEAAKRSYLEARKHQFGLLAGLPAIRDLYRSLAGKGVVVIEDSGAKTAPVSAQSKELFHDCMHPSYKGHARLARAVARELIPRLRP